MRKKGNPPKQVRYIRMSEPMNWNQFFNSIQQHGQAWLQQLAGDLQLLVDTSQLNRRTRKAWRQGRTTRACFLLADHQRRRITRRREIRRLIEG